MSVSVGVRWETTVLDYSVVSTRQREEEADVEERYRGEEKEGLQVNYSAA